MYSEQAYENYYFRGFLTGLTLRESCYSCQYKNSKRIGDIMIGDFIGFGVHIPYEGESKRPSLIIATNEKGVNYIKSCEKDIVLVERTIEEAMIDGRSLREPFPRHEKQKIFRDEYRKKYPDICRAIHQENKGHGGAVNTGIKNATGIYLNSGAKGGGLSMGAALNSVLQSQINSLAGGIKRGPISV